MSGNIKVAVRLRPLDEGKNEKMQQAFEIHGRRITFGAKIYDPDVTLRATTTQEEVFEQCVPILESVRNGANGTIMVYGQTGTGKTHTMFGGETPENAGVVFRAIEYLLNHVRANVQEGKQMSLTMSMLEIYCEKITDMMADGEREVTLINGFPRSCQKKTLTSLAMACAEVKRRLASRHVGCTAMNERSSRSHVIMMLDLEEMVSSPSPSSSSSSSVGDEAGVKVDVAHLFLVDLAGSESIKKSQATGKAASEAGSINRSLLALKNVILTLSNAPDGTKPHVPYRDSRLTEMLQDSIGGTARTMLVACISPNGRDLEETRSTLEYASKARSIRNTSNTERDKLTVKVRNLEVELQRFKNRLSERLERGPVSISKEEYDEMERTRGDLAAAQETIDSLMKERATFEAKEHITVGQLEMLQGMVQEKEAVAQRAREDHVAAVARFESTWRDVADGTARVLGGLEGAVAAEWERTSDALHAWRASALAGNSGSGVDHAGGGRSSGSATTAEVRVLCDRINDGFRTALAAMAARVGALGEALQSAQAEACRAEEGRMLTLQAAIVEAVGAAGRDRERRMRETRESVTLATNAATAAANRTPDAAHPIGFAALVENAVHDTVAAATLVLPERAPPVAVTQAFFDARAGFVRPIRAAGAAMLQPLTTLRSCDSMTAPTARASNNNNNTSNNGGVSALAAFASSSFASAPPASSSAFPSGLSVTSAGGLGAAATQQLNGQQRNSSMPVGGCASRGESPRGGSLLFSSMPPLGPGRENVPPSSVPRAGSKRGRSSASEQGTDSVGPRRPPPRSGPIAPPSRR